MKRVITFSILIFSQWNISFCQAWSNLGTGFASNLITNTAAIEDYNGNLLAGGWIDTAGGNYVKQIAQWDGSNWSGVGGGITNGFSFSPYEMITAMTVYNGALYIGGRFDSVAGVPMSHIAMWNGTTWSSVGGGIDYNINALIVYNSNLYAGGYFDIAGGNPANSIAMWNGTTWSALGGGLTYSTGNQGTVNALSIYNGNLLVAGCFNQAGGNPASNIAKWDGSSWTPINTGIRGGCVYSIAVFNSELYVGGEFDSAGSIMAKSIVSWDGTVWSDVGVGVSYNLGGYWGPLSVFSLVVYNNTLYVGGGFDSAGGMPVNNIAAWDGTTWSPLISGVNNVVLSLHAFNGALYVGGGFDMAGSIKASYIAEWNAPAGINEINKNHAINIFPNPSSGTFTIKSQVAGNNYSVEIYNIFGELVFKEIRKPADDKVINLTVQANGVYFYRVLGDDGKFLGEGKIVIQH